MRLFLCLACVGAFSACAAASESDADPVLMEHALATKDGELALGTPARGELSRAHASSSWVFRLSDRATVDLRTETAEDGPEIDTVLTLQRESQHGPRHILARNDDRAGSKLSELSRSLPAGGYRVVVQGFHRRTEGLFVLDSRCSGPGCPVVPQPCLFGATYRALRESARFQIRAQSLITRANAHRLSPTEAVQLLSAVNVTYTDAHDLSAALGSVDQSEVNRTVLQEIATGRRFIAYEYGAGDNSYGAVFEAASADRAVEIRDGDLHACKVFGTPRGAREGAECSADWGLLCDEGLTCLDVGDPFGAGKCSRVSASAAKAAP